MQRSRTYLQFVLAFVVSTGFAQQEFQITQYMFNPFSFNPAYAGTRDCVDARVGTRVQWSGFKSNRLPVTKFVNIHGAFKNKYMHVKTKHAIGMSIMNDQAGRITNTKLMLAYAYHAPLSYKVNLSMGLFAGANQYKFETGDLRAGDASDPAIPRASTSYMYPDITAGIRLMTWKKTFYAISVSQLVNNKIPEVGSAQSRLVPHAQFLVGKSIEHKVYKMEIVPSMLLKAVPFSAPSADFNLLFNFSDEFVIGGSYRSFDAFAGIMQVKIMKYFTLGYSFDFTTSRMRLASSNTHEIMLGIYVCPEKTGLLIDCPAFN